MRAREHPRLRADLTWRRFVTEGQDAYIFKDEISQEYLKLDAISGALALRLDGRASPDELLEWARETWPSLEFDADYIADVVEDLRRYRFLEDPFERNALLAARAHQERAQINATTFKSLLSIPLGTVDPDRFLNRTYPAIRWIFAPFFVGLGIALFLLSAYVVWLNRDLVALQSRSLIPGLGMGPLGAFLMWLTVTITIVIHELGHGYAVKHHGGKVHRLGFIFIFGLPCMFCDTSDSHLFPDWKHRAAVALAGTYTELYVAALATLVWWLTPPELIVHQLAYNVMLFASISGIVFNYNPLIKMDGYFVLADWLDMPNLQEDAYGYLGWQFRRRVLGARDEPCPVEGRRRKRVLLLYAVTSIVYSVSFGLVVFAFMRNQLIHLFAFAGALLASLMLFIVLRRLTTPMLLAARGWALDHRGLIRRHQLPIVAAVALALGAFLLLPVPGRRAFEVAIEPSRQTAVVAAEPMRLERAAWRAGMAVEPGTVLAVLDAGEEAARHRESLAEAASLRIQGAGARRSGDARAAVVARSGAVAADRQAELLLRRVRRAELRAPHGGRVLTQAPLGAEGHRLEAGDTLCVIADFSSVRATARLWEFDLEDIEIGSPVRLRLRSRATETLRGRVAAIQPAVRGAGRRTCEVRISLDRGPRESRAGLTGRAWIATPARPPAAHLTRMLARFVRLDLWV
jgi:putative peptide zinc metalloprotease protein